jgi:HEAT repeat protein
MRSENHERKEVMVRFRVVGPVVAALAALGWSLGWATTASAYVDMAPTLAKIVSDSKKIAVVEVVAVDRAKRVVTLKEVQALFGEGLTDSIEHQLAPTAGATVPHAILQWAAPGARGVLFSSRNTALLCMGQGWYQVRSTESGGWRLAKERPDLPLAYHGAVSRLSEAIRQMLAGKDAVLTVVSHGADNEGASFDLALNRAALPGMVKVQRIRANLKMPPMVMAASANAAYVIGMGAVDEADVAALTERLQASEATTRAEAADDLRTLGRIAASAANALTKLLDDSERRVRFAAAAALLQIGASESRARDVLGAGLASNESPQRREAAKAVGLSGAAAGPLAEQVAALLKDSDESVGAAALQAIAGLGPAAANVADAVALLLDEPGSAVEAADALGRIGAPAASALPRLAKMLDSEQPAVRWAAVRAMAQIGGEGAHPAVDFMLRTLKGNASEVEGYNMMIYFALLGPVATDALPTIRSVRIKNPVLPSATMWAIQSDRMLPWQSGGRGPGPGGPGGEGPQFGVWIYESYIHELGPRLQPSAMLLARKLLDGTAGEVPEWGYKLLACGGNDVLELLAGNLAHEEGVQRERAAVALGHMGPAAAAKKDRVEEALRKSASDREKRLLTWCLRKVTRGS